MNKKGLTLIELLAVIVVLAIIALIAIPSILGVIEKARKGAYKDSVYGIIDSARIYLTSNVGEYDENGEIEFVCNGQTCSHKNDSLSFKGNVPKSGSIYVKGNGDILVESLYNGRYYANNESGEVVITSEDTTMTRGELTNIVKRLEQENKELKQSVSRLNDKDNSLSSEISSVKSAATSIDKVYPVGSIYISASNVNPSTLYPGTEWENFGEGRTLLGTKSTSEQIGGNNSVTLSTDNLPSHSHSFKPSGTVKSTFTGTPVRSSGQSANHYHGFSGTTSTTGNHTHQMRGDYGADGGTRFSIRSWNSTENGYVTWSRADMMVAAGNHAHTFSGNTGGVSSDHTHDVTAVGTVTSTFNGSSGTTGSTGSGSSINIQNPYITVYMWKRVK